VVRESRRAAELKATSGEFRMGEFVIRLRQFDRANWKITVESTVRSRAMSARSTLGSRVIQSGFMSFPLPVAALFSRTQSNFKNSLKEPFATP
jgi:hypothetical protein